MKDIYYVMTSHKIGEFGCGEYHWLITEWNLGADCPGVTIEYVEETGVKASIGLSVEAGIKLRDILNKIDFETLNKQ